MRSLIACVVLVLAVPAGASEWRVEHEASELAFAATQDGSRFEGRFRRFQAGMRFDPADLDSSRFDVTIRTASATTGDAQRDRRLPRVAWFHSDAFPEARFETRSIRPGEGAYAYRAVADLTIRDTTRRIVLPFDWSGDGDTAVMEGQVTLDRTEFGIGQGQWAACSTVSCQVTVMVDLRLQRQD